MANFNEAFEILMSLEFREPSDALHINPTEEGLTFMGIYEKAHPYWIGWRKIKGVLREVRDLERASKSIYEDEELKESVKKFYKKAFWDKMRGDEITSALKANEIFIFGVNVGIKKAILLTQEVVGAEIDGVFGEETLNKLNAYDEALFDREFDRCEIGYYKKIVQKNPRFRVYANGWRNRALAV